MSKKLKPFGYTKIEGGEIYHWRGGKVDTAKMAFQTNRHTKRAVIAGVECHSIFFPCGKQWDCINGWETK